MLKEWVHASKLYATGQGDHYVSNTRKIFRDVRLGLGRLYESPSLELPTIGYKVNKIRTLERHYLQAKSRDMAITLWDFYHDSKRAVQNSDSVSFTTHAHLIKNKMERRRGVSAMGPCLQAVVITAMDPAPKIDLFYRTSDLLKKFPADLIFVRDVLLKGFKGLGEATVQATFANLTVASPYYPVMFQFMDNIPKELERIRRGDRKFWAHVVSWSAQYYCPEHKRGIDKYSQTRALKKFALTLVTDKRKLRELQKYLRDNHQGYSRDYIERD